jgi:hypothetical protein
MTWFSFTILSRMVPTQRFQLNTGYINNMLKKAARVAVLVNAFLNVPMAALLCGDYIRGRQ